MSWVCPKENCPDKTSLKNGDKCPTCGAEAKEFGFFDLKFLLDIKDTGPEKVYVAPKEVLQNTTGTEGLGTPGMDVSGHDESVQFTPLSAVDQANLLNAVFEQNKVLIQQSKLIYELLRKITPPPSTGSA